MTQKNAVNGELISALVDGEAAADELAQAVALAIRTPQGQVAWHAYHVVGEALRARGLRVTRLARGVPIGSELEYVDLGTIAHALSDRR